MSVNVDSQKVLLNDKRVVDEINRHLWIESEKVGYDIGFDKAKEDWLKNFSRAWMRYHIPDALRPDNPVAVSEKAAKASSSKRRRAKSYLR